MSERYTGRNCVTVSCGSQNTNYTAQQKAGL